MSRHGGWMAAALVVVGSVVLGLAAPSSWWGVTEFLGVAGVMAGLRGVVPESYRAGWTRSTVLMLAAAACGGAAYAFAVEPWGPVPQVSWPLFVVLLIGVGVLVADAAQVRKGGVMLPQSREEVEAYRSNRSRGYR